MSKRFKGLFIYLLISGLALLNLFQFSRQTTDEEIVERFHKIFYDRKVWAQNTWLGVAAFQNPNDVWIHQEIIVETRPDFIVECGTMQGGSAALWATILQQANSQGRVITIDIADDAGAAKKLPIVQDRVDFLIGSSTSPQVLAEVSKRVEGKKVLVILDSDHSRDHVLAELRAYARFVPKGSYVIVQDSNVNGHPVLPDFGPGPMEAIQDFLRENAEFEIDRSRERLLFTMHPNGYLKRIK